MAVLISVKDLVQEIGRSRILDGISFQVSPGEFFGIFGTRGTGKTTLLHILAGLDRFTSGQVEVMGCDLRKSDKFKQELGIVTQERSLFQDLSVAENLDFIRVLKNASPEAVDQAIERLELKDYLNKPLDFLDTMGAFQRLSLACALLNRPRLLLADELIKDIDIYSRNLIIREMNRFRQNGGACICTLSSMDYGGHLDKVAWLEKGKIEIYEPAALAAEWHRQCQDENGQGDRHV